MKEMEPRHTKKGKVRAARPDGEKDGKIYLVKATMHLRLTYQIRLLAFMAKSRRKKLVILLKEDAVVHETLEAFVREMRGLVKIEKG